MAPTTGAEHLTSVARGMSVCCSTEPVEAGKKRMTLRGSFWEKSNSANSHYRAEQLGVCAIQHLIAALTFFYKIENCSTEIWCNNG